MTEGVADYLVALIIIFILNYGKYGEIGSTHRRYTRNYSILSIIGSPQQWCTNAHTWTRVSYNLNVPCCLHLLTNS